MAISFSKGFSSREDYEMRSIPCVPSEESRSLSSSSLSQYPCCSHVPFSNTWQEKLALLSSTCRGYTARVKTHLPVVEEARNASRGRLPLMVMHVDDHTCTGHKCLPARAGAHVWLQPARVAEDKRRRVAVVVEAILESILTLQVVLLYRWQVWVLQLRRQLLQVSVRAISGGASAVRGAATSWLLKGAALSLMDARKRSEG